MKMRKPKRRQDKPIMIHTRSSNGVRKDTKLVIGLGDGVTQVRKSASTIWDQEAA